MSLRGPRQSDSGVAPWPALCWSRHSPRSPSDSLRQATPTTTCQTLAPTRQSLLRHLRDFRCHRLHRRHRPWCRGSGDFSTGPCTRTRICTAATGDSRANSAAIGTEQPTRKESVGPRSNPNGGLRFKAWKPARWSTRPAGPPSVPAGCKHCRPAGGLWCHGRQPSGWAPTFAASH
jgi:hypothetical protein